MYDIVVIGAGIVGLSTARCIQRLLPDRKVTVIADKFTRDTTSDGAAGIFFTSQPLIPSTEKYRKWCEDSFRWFHHLLNVYDPASTGIQRLTGYQLSDKKGEISFHHDIVYDFRQMTDRELGSISGNRKYENGWQCTTQMIECRRYLPWLTQQFLSSGGTFERRTINNIEEFAGACSCLVNCSAMGSAKLFNEKEMFVVRGHTIRLKAPWVKHFYYVNAEDTYIFPGQGDVVIGGTRQTGQYDTAVDDNDQNFQDILEKCTQLLPSLKYAEVDQKWVGLRPHRSCLRVEAETKRFGETDLKIVHNYGHGANGITLSWGTAVEAAGLVKEAITSTSTQSRL